MSLDALSQSKLPINRKERFYTGTVLPAIICRNEFQDFGKFLDLVGVSGVNVNPDPVNANLQFFTEYGLAESVIGDDTRRRFPHLPPERDIPDIVILIDKYIVAIEAKMYDSISARQINTQMNRQWKLLNYLSNLWNLEVRHIALLPQSLAKEIMDHSDFLCDVKQMSARKIVAWEEVLSAYEHCPDAPKYFVHVLKRALEAYGDLKSKMTIFGKNSDCHMSGEQIVNGFQFGKLNFKTMGRKGGFEGDLLEEDFAGGDWRAHKYEVSDRPDPVNQNWFPIELFFKRAQQISNEAAPGTLGET